MTNTEETTRQHLSLLLVVMGQGFILFFSVVVLLFLPRRDEDSLSITLPASFLFFDCSSSAEVLLFSWGGSQSPFHHAITLSVPCSNFLLHPVITVHHWGRSRSLNVGSSLCKSQSVLASLLLFGICSQSWVSVPASSYSLFVCLSLSYSSAQSPSFLSLSLFASLHYFHCFAAFLWIGPPDFRLLSASLSGECLTLLSGGMKLSEVLPEENAFSSSTHLCGYRVLTAWSTLVPRCSVNFTEELKRCKQGCLPDTQLTSSHFTHHRQANLWWL